MKELAEYVATLRDLLGMTQKDFAESLGVSRSYISAIENNDREPNVDFLMSIRQRHGISIDALFDDVERLKNQNNSNIP